MKLKIQAGVFVLSMILSILHSVWPAQAQETNTDAGCQLPTTATSSKSYEGVVPVRTIIRDLMEDLKPLKIGSLEAIPLDWTIENYVQSGVTVSMIRNLLWNTDFYFYEENGTLHVRKKGEGIRTGTSISEESGMIGAPEITEKGVKDWANNDKTESLYMTYSKTAQVYRQKTKDLFFELMTKRNTDTLASMTVDLWYKGENHERAQWVAAWEKRVSKHIGRGRNITFKDQFFFVPFMQDEGLHASDLSLFQMANIIDNAADRDFWLQRLEARFWLAIICDDFPDTCAYYADKYPMFDLPEGYIEEYFDAVKKNSKP